MMDTRDAEHELNIEISENDVRKDFSKAERVDYINRLLRIEQAKAKERMLDPRKNFSEGGKAIDNTAKQFGISGIQARKEIAIADDKDMFSLEEFANWDEGKLSTNKAFQMLKLRLEEAEQKLIEAEENPEVVEVTPKDYQEAKFKAKAFDRETQRLNQKLEEAYRERNKLQERIEELEKATPEGLDTENLSQNVFYFCTMCNNFIGNVGGLVWLTDRVAEMPDKEREMFLKAAASFKDWSLAFTDNLERRLNDERNHNTGTAELPY
jgi:ParB family chromosome partitioning protein